ncbi:helix-turn-helix transcriptional regulator [Acinetobacter baumannii]|uniref:AlpA family phage regulatory protein n=1 Tax=Acinetobacter baumannii TaxID=470 RepID=A0A505MPX7_ACIBA|nr:AlpA family phage regulatory protein [Acinetobacter baumannii]EJB8495725.1 AlpA family phage regulatory protein [Acinetobacter baumannii]ELB0341874.1 AlpA family phage regulatory protein [Acinetobacter baumannii]KCY24557.1 prophage CP4-57 regulatory family protein [Acinetobacter baumannii 233846]MCJ8816185.1 AlpA family phage regulatory protein [Acinetobacter baumannii]MCJ8987367.1 AlpA family phage regulatory protein [Acinetobacter baumannii]
MNASFTQTTFVMNKIINIKQVIEFTGLSRATLYNLLDPKSEYYDSTSPKQVRLTTNRVGWSAFEINEWIESKLAQR